MGNAVTKRYWHVRSLEFIASDLIHIMEWGRIPGDILTIVGGCLPLVYLAFQAVLHPNRVVEAPEPMEASLFTEVTEV